MAAGLMALGMGINVANSLFGAFQLMRGLSQANRNKRPEYNIPQEIGQNLNQAQMLAQQGLPMEQYNRAMANIDRNAAFGLRGMSDRRGGLVGLADLNQTTNDAYNNLAMQDAQARMNNIAQLYNARSTMANYRDKAFEINQMQPYLQQAQAAQGMQGAGLQNIMGGLQGIGNMASSQAYYNALNPMGGGMGNGMEAMMAKNMMGGGQQFNPYQTLMNNFSNPFGGYAGYNLAQQTGAPLNMGGIFNYGK